MSVCQYCRNNTNKTHFGCRKDANCRTAPEVCSCCGGNHNDGKDHTKCMKWTNFPGC